MFQFLSGDLEIGATACPALIDKKRRLVQNRCVELYPQCPAGSDSQEHVMRYGVAFLVFCAVAAGVFWIRSARAGKPYLEQFKAVYVNPKATDREKLIFNEAVEKDGCNLCHLPKPSKGYNAYGQQLTKLLTKADGNNPQKIRAALAKVGKMKSKPDDPNSPTFGERIKQGKLPVGEIKVVSKTASN
jgi:hypothetical protein